MPFKSAITWRRGSYTEYTNIANELSRIYSVIVPKGEVWEIDPSRPFILYLLCKDEGVSYDTTTSATPSNNILIPKTAGGDNAPAGRYEVVVGTVGGSQQRLTITARTSTSITWSEAVDTGTTVDLYYIPDVKALVQLRVEDPRYMVELQEIILQEDIRILQKPDPYKVNTMYNLKAPHLIPPDFMLSIYLDAAWTVAWEDSLGNALPVFMYIPIIVHPADQYRGLEEEVPIFMNRVV